MNDLCIGFPPSVNESCRVLVLGSMPSVKSLAEQEYYAHPQNRFWPMMTNILTGGDVPPTDYHERLQMLLDHHIALWDAIASCRREGSLDSAIHDELGNDFAAFLERWPKITMILCNGGKSFQCFKRYNKALLAREDLTIKQMPSTSPANARWRLGDLVDAWRKELLSIRARTGDIKCPTNP